MGKGKNKNKKETKYKAPDEKFLVVIDPWGTPGNPSFINNVGAWFEIMLMQDHPGETVRAIYTQKTHNNIIVELSEYVEIEALLGAHIHSQFLSPSHNYTDGVSYIYEYDYEKQHHPGRRSWAAAVPTYESIPDIFPIKQPYPIPSLAPVPPYNVNYAKRPKDVLILGAGTAQYPYQPVPGASGVHLGELTSPPETIPYQRYNPGVPQEMLYEKTKLPDPTFQPKDTSNPAKFTPVSISQHDNGKASSDFRVKKRDPYEEAYDAERLLQNASFTSSGLVKQEEGKIYSNAGEFLDSILPVKKEEPIMHVQGQSIKREDQTIMPPRELLSNPAPRVKTEEHTRTLPPREQKPVISRVKDGEIPNSSFRIKEQDPNTSVHRPPDRVDNTREDNYQPSADLLAAFAGLPQEFLTPAPATHAHATANTSSQADPTFIKKELIESSIPPSDWSRGRSSTLATDRGSREPSAWVKPEPQDNEKIPTLQSVSRTRDPRLLGRARGGGPVKHRREEEAKHADREITKRIKHEQE